VISEDIEGAKKLTSSLLEKNIKSIGLIGAIPHLITSIEREQGFQEMVNTQENLIVTIKYGNHFSIEQGQFLMRQMINTNQVPDAILVTSYSLFEGVLEVLLSYPEILKTIKIATFGNNKLLDFLPIKIQSLAQQFDIITDKTLEFALSAKQTKGTQIEIVPRKLIKR
jgi:LacI family fructose operon transcriptional repressor